ncbi:MAG: bifunctional glutamate N-acetyltransferase/amino-acid acetyltransferase ArgJ [Balneolaceae bacterium]
MQNNLCDVKGIRAWGAHMGIKSKRRDLALIVSDKPATAAAVFTRNLVCAEPVKLSRIHVRDGKLQAFVINSGNANACTGKKGWEGAVAMAETTAECLGIEKESVLVASTGIIGEPFPTDKVLNGIRECSEKLSRRNVAGSLAANAILTTDTFAKEGFTSFKLNGKKINMAGIAKGSGMIHPDMATMLAFIVSDAEISSELLNKALKEAVDKTFNMITVDGDTSTNDMVGVMCNGMAENDPITSEESKEYKLFAQHLKKLCTHLAMLIVSDGEGSTKLVEYRVEKASSEKAARQIVRTVSDSNLVKTAIFGTDPNWGRIFAAAGRAGVEFDPDQVDLYFGTNKSVQVLKRGQPTDHSRAEVKKEMQTSTITITLVLNQGDCEAVGWGSDLSYEYVRINAEYTT